MHLLDLPEDALLEIIQRLRLVDVPTLVQTCKAFASLRETHFKPVFNLLRLVHKYALGSETLDIPPIGAEVHHKLALPYKFEEAMISGSLSENSLQRYETTVTNEDVYNASLFPGGRWLVTVSGNRQPDAIESSLPSHIPAMKYRIWDLQKSRTDLPMSPVAYVSMPPDESEISGEIWLRDDEDGEGYQIWVYSDHKLKELVFGPQDCSLYERRSTNVLGLDTSYDIGFHGNYVFNYEEEFHILDRNNGVRASFEIDPEPMDGFLRWYRFLTVVDDGLVLLDSDKQDLLYYRPNVRQWGLRVMLGDDQFKSPRLELLRTIPIHGIQSPIKDDFLYNLVVNRPFSSGKSSTALARFASTLVHFEILDDPALEDFERSFRIFPFAVGRR